MRTVKVGVVGCGGIANGKHMPSLKKSGLVEMVAFCDIIPERAVKAAADFGVPDAVSFADYRDLLKISDIEVVHICTPNSSHAEITIAALEAGKHVMCEKPMAHRAADARKMVEAAKKSGKKLTIGYQTRSTPEYQMARKLVEQGVLGNIYYWRAPSIRRRGIPTWGVFLDSEKQGGGPMIDIGTHSIDATLFVTGNYDVASVTGSNYRMLADTCGESNNARLWTKDEYKVEDSCMGYVKFKNGATMLVETSWAINLVDSGNVQFVGDKAGLDKIGGGNIRLNGELNGALYTQQITTNKYSRQFFKGEELNDCEYEAKQWITSVIEDTDPIVKCEQALVVSEIIEAIYKSSETGKTIYFD